MMKRNNALSLAIFILLLAFTIPAFAAETDDAVESIFENTAPTIENEQVPTNTSLIVYFSHTGNTLKIAEFIHELTGADLFEIESVTPCPEDYDKCANQAKMELATQALPQLANSVENIAVYDTIYLGYPIWFNSVPRPVATFLTEYDLEGKTIIPFCTYGSGGIGNSVTDIRDLVPHAIVTDAFGTPGANASEAKDAVSEWLKELPK